MSSTQVTFSSGDISFLLICSALVMFMIPGLGLFYGGMVRTKNALHTYMQSFVALLVVAIQWFFWGFSLAYADGNKVYGNLDFILLL
jgi:Amt family ammonium transporter